MKKQDSGLRKIPGVGPSIEKDLQAIGIKNISDLIDKNPDNLYEISNKHVGSIQDRCLLYVYRCAVYYSNTDEKDSEKEKLKWWNWKDKR